MEKTDKLLIQVSRETAKNLKLRKVTKQDSYDEIIVRMMINIDGMMKGGELK